MAAPAFGVMSVGEGLAAKGEERYFVPWAIRPVNVVNRRGGKGAMG